MNGSRFVLLLMGTTAVFNCALENVNKITWNLTVRGSINLFGHFRDFNNESLLDFFQHFGVFGTFFVRNKRDGQSLSSKSTSSTNSMQVGIGVVGHVVIDHDIDTFDIDTSTQQVGGNHDSVFVILEVLISVNSSLVKIVLKNKPFFLGHSSVN
jgi:hypothetical protein